MRIKAPDSVIHARLQSDPLRHVVTLKMLHLAGSAAECRLHEDSDGWALLTILPVSAIDWDRNMYPDRDWIIFVDGNSQPAKQTVLAEVPAGKLVIKTYDEAVKEHFGRLASTHIVRSFVSFTAPVEPANYADHVDIDTG